MSASGFSLTFNWQNWREDNIANSVPHLHSQSFIEKDLSDMKKEQELVYRKKKKKICTSKGGFLQIAFTIVIIELHVLGGEERNKTDKCHWTYRMKKIYAQALPFPWFLQYSSLSGKPLMKTKLLCLCFQYRLTCCRNKCFGVLIKCNVDKVVVSTFFFFP